MPKHPVWKERLQRELGENCAISEWDRPWHCILEHWWTMVTSGESEVLSKIKRQSMQCHNCCAPRPGKMRAMVSLRWTMRQSGFSFKLRNCHQKTFVISDKNIIINKYFSQTPLEDWAATGPTAYSQSYQITQSNIQSHFWWLWVAK